MGDMRTAPLLVLFGAFALLGAACTDTGTDSATRAELAGTDSDGNGVRDDVDTKVQQLADGDEVIAGYLHEVALNTQDVVTLDTSSTSAANEAYQITTTSNRLVSCPPGDLELGEAFALLEQVQNAVTNTAARRSKVDELSELIDGRAFPAPDCDQPAPSTTTNPSP